MKPRIKETLYLEGEFVKPRPKTQTPKAQPSQANPVKISSKGTGADTKILWATHPTHHPQLFSMKEASNKKTQRVKVT